MYDVLIVGSGVIGAACAYTLSKYRLKVALLDKCNDVANGTTKANSAIIHAGYDPHPGTRMARLNVEGNAMMESLCRKLDVPYKRVGSHVLAFNESEVETLKDLFARGEANGVPGQKILTGDEVREMEPNLADTVVASLWAPSAGIISPWELALAMAETAVSNGVELYLEHPVTAIEKNSDVFEVTTPKGVFRSCYVLNAAGVHSQEIAEMVGPAPFKIQPNKGEYYLLDKSEGSRVSAVIFQCPNENGKGVLVSPTVHGNLIVGPSAENVTGDKTPNTADGLAFVREKAVLSVPSVSFRDNIRNFTGIRANHAKDDFILEESVYAPGLYHLAGIKSPGLTAAPAIALEMLEWLKSKVALVEKEHYVDTRKRIRFNELTTEEKDRMIQEDPRYGRVICRCETVTEGEIVAAIHSPIPPTTINGVKRRVGAGMGRCQGGFCGPRVQEILARELGVPLESILMDQPGTYILTGRTKGGQNG